MADRKDKKNIQNVKAGNLLGESVDLDTVDWGAVARSYKILWLRSSDLETFEKNEKLSEDYYRWVAMRENSIEFDIALRMHFDESLAAMTTNIYYEHDGNDVT